MTLSDESKDSPMELFLSVMGLVDALVELYLGSIIKPFLALHEKFYTALNATLRSVLDGNHVPEWFTANLITYFRTVLIIPCLLLLAWGQLLLPSIIVLLVDFGDFLDGVVARYWVDERKNREELKAKKDAKDPSSDRSRSVSPVSSDDDSFEVVTTGSPHSVVSWTISHRNRTYGGFVDAVCDKAFVVPCWIYLLSTVPLSWRLRSVQYVTLWSLILAETASGCIRFRAFYTATGVPAPSVQGLDFSTSAVKADHIGKAKQTFEMVGTTLFILPYTHYLGLLLLFLAVPLAYESVRRKVKKRVIYIVCSKPGFDHKVLKFWMQAKGMGSKLILGVPGTKQTDMVLNACATSCVDQVICEAPAKADTMFLEKNSIDYVVSLAGEPNFVTDEVIGANRCLSIGENGVARPIVPKESHKD